MFRFFRFPFVGILVVVLLPTVTLCGCKKSGNKGGTAAENADQDPFARSFGEPQDLAARSLDEAQKADQNAPAQPSDSVHAGQNPATAEEFDSPHEPLFPDAKGAWNRGDPVSDAERQAAARKRGSAVLKVYLPGEYINLDSVKRFKKQYGVDVILEFFDSNEMMYAKLLTGEKYDILIPSDYMIERLLKLDMLQPLDKAAIPNLSQLDPAVTHLAFDPNNDFSVPYFWGNVGILYDKAKVDAKDLEAGWSILRNTKYKGRIFWYDSERDSFMVALKALGYSMNTRSEAEIQKAYEWLVQMRDTMEPSFVTDEVLDSMAVGIKDIAVVYSGDAANLLRNDSALGSLEKNSDLHLGFVAPNEGTNVWYDAMVIPANAENPKLAHEFINFFVDYEAAKANAELVGYTSPNGKVIAEMTAAGGEFAGNPAYRPRTGNAKDEILHYDETMTAKTAELWDKLKAGSAR